MNTYIWNLEHHVFIANADTQEEAEQKLREYIDGDQDGQTSRVNMEDLKLALSCDSRYRSFDTIKRSCPIVLKEGEAIAYWHSNE